MDLNELWQEHKVWILGAFAGLLFFLIGRSFISSTFSIERSRKTILSAHAKTRKQPLYDRAAYRKAQEEAKTLRERIDRRAKALFFQARPEYRLEGKGDASLHYLNQTSAARKRVKEEMDAENVDFLARNLGLPSKTPFDRDEIQEVLYGLDLVEDALDRLLESSRIITERFANQSGLASVESLKIRPIKKGYAGRSVRKKQIPELLPRVEVLLRFRADSLTTEGFVESLLGGKAPGGAERRPLLLKGIKIEEVGQDPGDPLAVECNFVILQGGKS
ncbi:MAG TPA: hypothetical protein ENK02_03830 [Planctomycetes bacterium]|nr:hypothetical protein [Planctomycetota bacterium]